MTTVANFSVSCTTELKAQLDAQVARESATSHISRSELVVKALTAYFNKVGAATPVATTTFKEILAPIKEEIAAKKAAAVEAPAVAAEEPVRTRRRRQQVPVAAVASATLIAKDEVA